MTFTLSPEGQLKAASGRCLWAGGFMQVWSKRLTPKTDQTKGTTATAATKVAVFVLSNAESKQTVTIDLQREFGLTGDVVVRDVWERKGLPSASGELVTDEIAPRDSRFYVLAASSPAAGAH